MARYYAAKNISVDPERIFLVPSTSDAYTYLFRLLANPGDTVLAPAPGYPLFEYLAGLNDLKLAKYPLTYGASWRLEEARLLEFSEKSPKALIWVHPNNPTGNFASPEEVRILDHFCQKNSCALISDEVFLDFAWDEDSRHPSFAGNEHTLTFTLSGISKTLGLPQMKLSWIVVGGPKPLRDEAIRRLEVLADTYLSVSIPVQNALPAWLERAPAVSGEILERVRKNFSSLSQTVKKIQGIEILKSEGGWYAVLRVKGTTDEEFCLKLLREKNVLMHPGYFFDLEKEDCVVVSLLTPPDEFLEGIQSLETVSHL